MKKLFQIVLVSCLSLLCFSCYYDESTEEVVEIIDIPDTQVIYFSTDIQPILSQCTGCHASSISPDLRETYSYNALVPIYVTAFDADNSRLYNYLPGYDHHDVGITLSADEVAYIKAWINQGALNN